MIHHFLIHVSLPRFAEIVYEALNMFPLKRTKTCRIQEMNTIRFVIITAKQIVCADPEIVSSLHQHIHGRHDVIILPIADALLLYTQFFCELHLV